MMKVLVADILVKIPDLPADFRERVTLKEGDTGQARVKSFSADDSYPTFIKVHDDDPGDRSILNATCQCNARTLCKHIVVHYAVAKGLGPEIEPDGKVDPEPVEPKDDALRRLTMEAIQADMHAHEARAAWHEEVERLLRGAS
jgi:hypothetical protein